MKLLKEILNHFLLDISSIMKGSSFTFNHADLSNYKCHKIDPNRSGSYIESPDWIKNKKATINSIIK